ncbi:MAG TPA: response regulator transcription factor [Gemmatimonadaceae bacterium]|nr:response regulator transcription factor [Gemmatimonadaceae bacterium]
MTKSQKDDDRIIRIVLADDHAVVREGLKSLLNAQADMCVVGEAGDGATALEVTRELCPDVVVTDLSMPGSTGSELTERIRQQHDSVKVLVLTVHEERLYLTRLFRAGASGYVLKRAAASDLVNAVRIVASGGTYIDPALAGELVTGFLDSESSSVDADDSLSEREREVLVRIARGFSNKEIAAELELSTKTVETYKARVAEKLGLHSRVEIIRYATRKGLLHDDQLM